MTEIMPMIKRVMPRTAGKCGIIIRIKPNSINNQEPNLLVLVQTWGDDRVQGVRMPMNQFSLMSLK